jgi:hypothetical protein
MAPKTKLTSFVPRLIFRSAMAGVIPACALSSCGNVSPNTDGSTGDKPASGGAGGGGKGGSGGATGSGGTTGSGGATGAGGRGGAGGGGAGGNRDGGSGGNTDAGRDSPPDIRIIVLAFFGFVNPAVPDEEDAPAAPSDWLRGVDDLGPAMAAASPKAATKRRARRTRG